MLKLMVRFLFLLLALSLRLPLTLSARNPGDPAPKALLVELLTRKGQVEYMRTHKPQAVEGLLKDINGVMQATVTDFSTNFSFCPVFFFVDTNAALIRDGKFDGVLLGRDMQPVSQAVLQAGDTNFFIAYYGSMMPQPDDDRELKGFVGNSTITYIQESGDAPNSLFPTLLVCDHRFRLLKLPLPRSPKGYASRSRLRRSKLSYRSKRYDIDYMPMAASYDATIDRYYARLRRKRAYDY